MPNISKKRMEVNSHLDYERFYTPAEAFSLVKQNANAAFDESIDISVHLSTDPKDSSQSVRGSCSLPSGTGKKVVIAVFAKDEKAKEAKDAGADIVGDDDLIEEVKQGKISFSKCLATPDMMPSLSKIARVLGPKGLMPSPKVGTVTNDISEATKKMKLGQVFFRTDKNSIVHVSIGRCSFEIDQLVNNFEAFMSALNSNKPTGLKGALVKKIYFNSTMGPALKIEIPGYK